MTRAKLVSYLTLGWLPHALAYVVAPLVVGHFGGGLDRPAWWSLLGTPFIAAGALMIAWAAVGHYRASPPRLQVKVRPNYLAIGGAYSRSRNPLYLGGGLLWIGWAIVFASLAIVIVGVALFSGLAFVGVPFEERMLQRRFGSSYQDYVASVPRWFSTR